MFELDSLHRSPWVLSFGWDIIFISFTRAGQFPHAHLCLLFFAKFIDTY